MHKILDGGSLRLRGVYDNSFYGKLETVTRSQNCQRLATQVRIVLHGFFSNLKQVVWSLVRHQAFKIFGKMTNRNPTYASARLFIQAGSSLPYLQKCIRAEF